MTADVTGVAREQSEQVAGTAQAEAQAVGGEAGAAAQAVVETAAEQAGAVAGEGVRNVRELLGDLRDELSLQASTQTMRAGELAYTFADDLEAMAEGSAQQGALAGLTRQAASRARLVGEFLQSRDPDQLLDEVRLFARRRPGAFLLGAAAAGVVAGRLGRGAVAARGGNDDTPAGSAVPRSPRPATVPASPPVTITPGVVVPATSSPAASPAGARDAWDEVPGFSQEEVVTEVGTDPLAAARSDLSATARRAGADARRTADARRIRR